jgi:hypothetical protein
MRYGMYRRSSLRSKSDRYPISCARDEPPAQRQAAENKRCERESRSVPQPIPKDVHHDSPRATTLRRATAANYVLSFDASYPGRGGTIGFSRGERDLRPFKGQSFGPCAIGRWPRSPGRELFNRAAAPKQAVGVAIEFATELGGTGWDWNAPFSRPGTRCIRRRECTHVGQIAADSPAFQGGQRNSRLLRLEGRGGKPVVTYQRWNARGVVLPGNGRMQTWGAIDDPRRTDGSSMAAPRRGHLGAGPRSPIQGRVTFAVSSCRRWTTWDLSAATPPGR